ncbi:MAG TPA: helix-turn-helix transcriptional regulator [Allosphingosinicella sp.]|jgi:DNA-binding PadR family transcriptional regulator
MTRKRALSSHARAMLGALVAAGPRWSYGYELMSRTGIRSGTLYPLLMRLEAQGYLEAQWQPTAAGRPPRHAYRLTAAGRALAAAEAAVTPGSVSPARGRAGEAAS